MSYLKIYRIFFNRIIKINYLIKSLAGRNELGNVTIVNDDSIVNQQNNVIMANHILSILEDLEFWSNLAELETLFYPYCMALNTLQKNKARLFEVLHCFGYFMKCTLSNPDDDFKDEMILKLEKRWLSWEQPLLLISFYLHPLYKLEYFFSSENITSSKLSQWIYYYYVKWFSGKPNTIVQELLAYKNVKYPFNDPLLKQLEHIPLDYWGWVSDHTPNLSKFCGKLFSICVNSAGCERLFSSMGFFHTKRRNKLDVSIIIIITIFIIIIF
jgi:hypothetical protein